MIVHILAGLAATVAAGLADELVGKYLPLFVRLPLAAAFGILVYRSAHAYIKNLREDLGR